MANEDHVEQLQDAARDAIGAVRGVLDALERIVDDDERMASVLAGITDVVRFASRTVADTAASTSGRQPDDPGGGPVQHIVVS